MTIQMRRQQADLLAAYCVLEGKRTWEAWRALHPKADCTDTDAHRMTMEEARWRLDDRRKEQETANSSAVHVDAEPRRRRCAGVADRGCSEEIPSYRTRCESCAAEHARLSKQRRNRKYYQSHRDELNEKRRERRAVRSKARKEEREREEQRRAEERQREEQRLEEERQREEKERTEEKLLRALWRHKMGDVPFPLDSDSGLDDFH